MSLGRVNQLGNYLGKMIPKMKIEVNLKNKTSEQSRTNWKEK
jgi:hypothetical protein